MDSPGDMKIAGTKTVVDWEKLKPKLVENSPRENWKEAYNFFHERLRTRYLDPIERLKETDEKIGEGFAIVTLLCSLIEFLAATREGKNYRHCQPDDCKCKEFEYHRSAKLFIDFMHNQKPFSKYFTNKTKAGDFYKNVRCPLFHEARTKGGWKIHAGCSSHLPFNIDNKIIYRNRFLEAINEYLESYKADLLTCKIFQRAFIRKINSLCVE